MTSETKMLFTTVTIINQHIYGISCSEPCEGQGCTKCRGPCKISMTMVSTMFAVVVTSVEILNAVIYLMSRSESLGAALPADSSMLSLLVLPTCGLRVCQAAAA